MATITETPEETLKSAFAKVAEADDYVKQQQRALDTAQGQADATKGFTEAAQVEFNNLEATYRVLLKRADSATAEEKKLREREGQLETERAEARAGLQRAQELHDAVEASRKALENVTRAADKWAKDAATAVANLASAESTLGTEAGKLPTEQQAPIKTAQATVKTQHDMLDPVVGDLGKRLATTNGDIKAVPTVPVSAEKAELKRVSDELDDVKKQVRAKRPVVSKSALDKAKEARDHAERTLNEAPETERRAQAGLREAQADLAEAEKRKATALAALESAENAFIGSIELSAPNNAGLVTATAQLSRAIPKGYSLRWKAGGAKVTPETGEKVVIDTSQLPSGATEIEARLEQKP